MAHSIRIMVETSLHGQLEKKIARVLRLSYPLCNIFYSLTSTFLKIFLFWIFLILQLSPKDLFSSQKLKYMICCFYLKTLIYLHFLMCNYLLYACGMTFVVKSVSGCISYFYQYKRMKSLH
jgi:hypothetical protein